jgi:putative sigma-54 modulation protein
MQFQIRGEKLEVTPALRDYVEKKVGRLEKYFNETPDSTVHVTMKVIRGQHQVEVTMQLPGVILRAEERNSDMYASIDLVAEKLERQIRKLKTRINRKPRQEGGLRGLFREGYEPQVNGSAMDLPDEEEDYELVRTKRFVLKPMDVQEAILQMNLIGHDFFVFNNTETSEINVVYRRNDGKYGLIEPIV